MRMRKKEWADDELLRSPIYLKDYNNEESFAFDNSNMVHLEIGIGKGLFLSKLAHNNLNINYIGVDIAEQMLAQTKRSLENEYLNVTPEERKVLEDTLNSASQKYFKSLNIKRPKNITVNKILNKDISECEINNIEGFDKKSFNEYILHIENTIKKRDVENNTNIFSIYKKLKFDAYDKKSYSNVVFFKLDAKDISKVFKTEDKIERIYLNFSNPWYKDRHKKRRLTHTNKLNQYKKFLVGEKTIFFKTDDLDFFNESRDYFKEAGFYEVSLTYDLKNEDIFSGNIVTEHEKMFSAKGVKINAAIYKYE